MKPLVLYMGGKRKLAPEVLRHLDLGPHRPSYWEPYVGMGAVYLATRASGWKGFSVLRDTNLGVTAVWKCLHDKALYRDFVRELTTLRDAERTNVAWNARIADAVPTDTGARAALWTWLQEGAFGGVPVGCDGTRWTPKGCSFDIHNKMRAEGVKCQTHDTNLLLKKLAALDLSDFPCRVDEGPFQDVSVFDVEPGSVLYCDPPYESTGTYAAAQHNGAHVGHAAEFIVLNRVVLSEQAALAPVGFREVWRGERMQAVKTHGKSDCTERILVGGA